MAVPRASSALLIGLVVASAVIALAAPRTGGRGPARADGRLRAGGPDGGLEALREEYWTRIGRGDRTGASSSVQALARALTERGRADAALGLLGAEERAARARDDGAGLAAALEGRAGVLALIGETQRAQAAWADAAELWRRLGDRAALARCLVSLADATEAGPRSRALYEEALRSSEQAGDGATELRALLGLARVAGALDDPRQAGAAWRRALAAARVRGDAEAVGESQFGLAEAARGAGMADQARGLYAEAIGTARTHGLSIREVEWRVGAATFEESLGNRAGAEEAYRLALRAEQTLGPAVGLADRQRAEVGRTDAYRGLVRIALGEQRIAEAFEASERMRARTLSSMLEQRDADLGAEVPAELQQERADLADRRVDLVALLTAPGLTEEERQEAEGQLAAVSKEAGVLEGRVRSVSARYRRLVAPDPATPAQVAEALDPGDLLVSYVVTGPSALALFLVSPDRTLECVQPALGPGEVDRAVRGLRERIERREPASRSDGRAVYDLVLGPLAGRLGGAKRLIVCPDGALHYAPFGALVGPEGRAVVEDRSLAICASATVFLQLRGDAVGRPAERRDLLAVGDPAYEGYERDPVESLLGSRAMLGGARVISRGAREGAGELPRLPHSGVEAAAIADLFAAKDRELLLGVNATEDAVRALAPSSRYVHLAAHGRLDPRNPMGSALVLSAPEGDAAWGGPSDGYLLTREAFGLGLNADLVTLSACSTALGPELRGEGILGMTQAVLYAGSPSVIASLWDVDDYSTGELMVRLYGGLRSGLTKDEALRRAMLETRALEPRLAEPYHWAAFQLYGAP